MGVVVNQTIKNVVITLLGFGLGAINTLFLFTNFMTEKHYGLVSYLLTVSNLIWPFLIVGIHNTIIKFYTSYADKNQQDKFLTTTLFIPFLSSLLVGLVGYLCYNTLLGLFSSKNEIVQPYVWTIFVLAFATTYFEVFFAWSKVKLKSVFGNLMKELFLRVCITVLLLFLYYKYITIHQFIIYLTVASLLRTFIMKMYAMRLHTFMPRFSLPTNYKDVFKYAALIVIAGSVASFMIDLDKTMIERYLPIENVAKYGICAYIASVIIIPSRAMHQITYPLTSKLLNEGLKDQLAILYKKSSLTLFIISGLLFVLIICNVKQLFYIIPDTYELYIWVVVLIGLTKLFDNLLGNNNAILYNSEFYRVILYIGVAMAVLMVVLNILFIPVYGVTGAAVASMLAVFCYNLSKLWVVYSKFNIQPFTKETLKAGGIILVFVLGFYFWEFSFHPIINIVVKSAIISLTYVAVVYKLGFSEDINALLIKPPKEV